MSENKTSTRALKQALHGFDCPFCTSGDIYIGAAHEVDAHCNSCGLVWSEYSRLQARIASLKESSDAMMDVLLRIKKFYTSDEQYNYSALSKQDADNAAFDAWLKIMMDIDSAIERSDDETP